MFFSRVGGLAAQPLPLHLVENLLRGQLHRFDAIAVADVATQNVGNARIILFLLTALPQLLVVQRLKLTDRAHMGRLAGPPAAGKGPELHPAPNEQYGRNDGHSRQPAQYQPSPYLGETQRRPQRGLHVVDRLRQRIDRQRMNIDRQRIARPDRVDQVLIDPQHGEASHAVASLVETGQQIALAESDPPSFGFQRVHGTLGQNLDVGRIAQKAVEHGKVDDLHHVLVHPYVQAATGRRSLPSRPRNGPRRPDRPPGRRQRRASARRELLF